MPSDKVKAYKAKWNAEWRKKHPRVSAELNRVYTRKYYRKLRQEIIEKYGGKCAKCGINDVRVLQIDHINNDGNKHRKVITTAQLPRWLKRNGYPKEFQILCANCNWIKKTENNLML